MWQPKTKPIDQPSKQGLFAASFTPDVRLGISPCADWLHLSPTELATAIQHLPTACRIFVCDSFFQKVRDDCVYQSLQFRGQSKDVVAGHHAMSVFRESYADVTAVECQNKKGDTKWISVAPAVYEEAELNLVRLQYSALLNHKRQFGEIVRHAACKKLKRDPTDSEWWEEFSAYRFPERRLLRASPSPNRDQSPNHRDAFLVHTWLESLLRGHHAVLLTSDRTVIEQFVSLCAVLATNYYAWVLADLLPLELEHELPSTPALFPAGFEAGPIRIPLSPVEVAGHLPANEWALNIQCWLLENSDDSWRFMPVSFRAECPMQHVMWVRGRNNGRNTDRFRRANVDFQWSWNPGSTFGSDGELWFYIERQLKLGTADCPVDREQFAPVDALPVFDVIHIQNSCDILEFPWHKEIRANPQSFIEFS